MSGVLFGKIGWILLLVTLALVFITAAALPTVMKSLQLGFPAKWAEATCIIVQITFGSWVGTVAASIARVAIWLRAVYAGLSGEEYAKERQDVTNVRNFSLWLLGIMTALATYMTLWMSK